jgi:hypothetical protein
LLAAIRLGLIEAECDIGPMSSHPQFRLPVQYIDRPGGVSDRPFGKSPVIRVVVSHPAGKPSLEINALIDSGADDIYLDARIIAQLGCRPSGQSVLTKAGGRLSSSPYCDVRFDFPQVPSYFDGRAVMQLVDDGTTAYAAIFGTIFLEMGQLVLNPKGESHFTFHADEMVSS